MNDLGNTRFGITDPGETKMTLEKPRLPRPEHGDPYLLTPGPLTTSASVKKAMLRDWGSWDADFRAMTADLRKRLVELLGDGAQDYDCVPMQGSGTFAVEAMLASFTKRDAKTLLLCNGAYGKRAVETMRYLDRPVEVLDKGDYLPPRGQEVSALLASNPDISHVLAVHCETSSGILNPLEEISVAVAAADRKLLIDSMSAFGAIPLDTQRIFFEAMVSSANKCIEGVPGFGFVLARKSALKQACGNSHSLSLDIHAQWAHLEKTGQWRFTPPTHAVTAFIQALKEHEQEGGTAARGKRYTHNRDVLVEGMRRIGFETLLDASWLSPIIVTFFCPADPAFEFNRFYDLMKARGFILYPGKLTAVDSFRIGCIGQMDHHVMQEVVAAAEQVLKEMGVVSAAPPPQALTERARLTN